MSEHPRTFRLDRLYFHYLQDTKWEACFTLESIAELLVRAKVIELVEDGERYAQLREFSKADLKKLIKTLGGNL